MTGENTKCDIYEVEQKTCWQNLANVRNHVSTRQDNPECMKRFLLLLSAGLIDEVICWHSDDAQDLLHSAILLDSATK